MIAVSSSGTGFRALAAYLAHGRTGLEEERIAWSSARNLPTADPEIAATLMRATAAQSVRVEKPVYHLVLAFDPGDPVDRAAMERVADRVLARLGLERHQVLIVAHRDREHPHLHLLVNRVHPETGKVWDRWQDMAAIQLALREEERALGLREVPGSQHAPVPEDGAVHAAERTPVQGRQLSDLLTVSAADPADGRPTSPTVPTLVERARAVLPAIREATTWSGLDSTLEQAGLRVERRGSGLVVTDGERYAKASTVGPDLTLRRLETRLGPHPTELGPYPSDEAMHARSVDNMEAARVPADRSRDTPLGPLPFASDPQVPMFAPRIGEATPGEAAHVARQVAQLEQLRQLAAAHWEAVQAHSAARASVAGLDAAVDRRDSAARAFDAVLVRVYQAPSPTRTAFDTAVRDHGLEAAAARLRDRPETYGSLRSEERPRRFGLAMGRDDSPARRAALEAASVALEVAAAERALAGVIEARSSSEFGADPSAPGRIARERTRRATTLGQAAAREQSLGAERRALPGAQVLELGIREGMRRLLPHEMRQLHVMLTRPQETLLARVRHSMREAVLGRDSAD